MELKNRIFTSLNVLLSLSLQLISRIVNPIISLCCYKNNHASLIQSAFYKFLKHCSCQGDGRKENIFEIKHFVTHYSGTKLKNCCSDIYFG